MGKWRILAVMSLISSIALISCAEESATLPKASNSSSAINLSISQMLAAGYVHPACASERCRGYVVTPTGLVAFGYKTSTMILEHERSTQSGTLPLGYGPADLQSAYALDPSGGAGRVVAIVDWEDYPTLESDLAAYRQQYGLPPCTTANGCFLKVGENGSPTSLPSNKSSSIEPMMDVDMVSAICPNCHILFVEANNFTDSDLDTAENKAVAMGAFSINNSWGGIDETLQSNVAAFNHPGVGITVASGDSGFPDRWGESDMVPALFSTVIAVGGTTLVRAANTRGWNETAWSGTSNACSTYIAKPAWQHDTGCAKRMIEDVAFDGNPATGVAVYAHGLWQVAGGTSIASPAIAAILALARDCIGDASSLYTNRPSLNAVTSGSTGTCTPAYFCNSAPGYNGPTGNGTPNGLAAFMGSSCNPVAAATPTPAATSTPSAQATTPISPNPHPTENAGGGQVTS